MSEPTTSPHSPEDRQKPRKLLILHLLDSQRQTGGLPPHSCDMLQRMAMIICAMSREIYGIAEVDIAPFTVIEKLHWYAACLSEGCTHLLNHIDALDMQARQLANGLPDLEKLNCRSLEECLLVWRATLQTLQIPTHDHAQIFEELAARYDEAVYLFFLQLHRKKRGHNVWCLHKQLLDLRHNLDGLHELSLAGANLADELIAIYVGKSLRFRRLAGREAGSSRRRKPPKIADMPVDRGTPKSPDQPGSSYCSTPITRDPPRLPPLPFETESLIEALNKISARGNDLHKNPVTSQSLSVVEDHRDSRHHRRSRTTGSHADLASEPGAGPHRSFGFSANMARRPGNKSQVPRVFTGSFNELEEGAQGLQLHKIKTPEAPPSTPVDSSPTQEGSVRVRDFAASFSDVGNKRSPVVTKHLRATASHQQRQDEAGGEGIGSQTLNKSFDNAKARNEGRDLELESSNLDR